MMESCPICLDDEDIDLKELSCGHKICVDCLLRLVQVDEGILQCPLRCKVSEQQLVGFLATTNHAYLK